ncbi:MAG: ankyrin repeat domain-containing protein [Desulfobacterales bacterium]
MGATPVPKGTTALSEAAHGGFADVVAFLIENGADVNAKDEDTDIDALFLAAEMGHMPVVKILVENGADVYAETKMGTALGAARHYGHPYIAAYIEEAREEVKKYRPRKMSKMKNEQEGS